jgi:hypothetical protein
MLILACKPLIYREDFRQQDGPATRIAGGMVIAKACRK